MPVYRLFLFLVSAPPVAGQTNPSSLSEAIQLFHVSMNKLRQTIQDQEKIISEQQAKIAKLEDENAGMEETIHLLTAEYSQLTEELAVKTKDAKESCEAEKTHMREEFDFEIWERCGEERTSNENEHSQEEEETNRQWIGSLIDFDIKQLYIDVINDMKIKFESGGLNVDQKVAATGVITGTQMLLGEKSFEVLGLQIGDRNSIQIFEVLKGWKEAGNMTAQQDNAMQDLAVDTQVRMCTLLKHE